MKISDETRSCILKACRSGVDQWTAGNSPEIILDALDELSDAAKLELCLRYLPNEHVLFRTYVRLMPLVASQKTIRDRDYTSTMEQRGI